MFSTPGGVFELGVNWATRAGGAHESSNQTLIALGLLWGSGIFRQLLSHQTSIKPPSERHQTSSARPHPH